MIVSDPSQIASPPAQNTGGTATGRRRRHRNSSENTWQSPWLDTLPPSYFDEFGDHLIQTYFPRSSFRLDFEQEWCRREFDVQLFVRMQQAQMMLVPWMREAVDIADLAILEIGCGTGSSTAPLAQLAGRVTACDISETSIQANRERTRILGINNVNYAPIAPDWLQSTDVHWPDDPQDYDGVLMYALFEHMMIEERLNFLRSLWSRLRSGAFLVMFETPNRLFPRDWHSSGCLFAQVLPDDLTAYYYSKSALPRQKLHVARRAFEKLDEDATTALYRWGRGASFHEFELAIGLENIQVLNDGWSPVISGHRVRGYGDFRFFEEALAKVLENQSPPIARGFARASLDLIIKKP